MTETRLLQRSITSCPKCGKPKRGSHSLWCGTDRGVENFWNRVDKSAGPEGCWLYTGFRKWDGYGWLSRGGRYMTAHRYAWILTNGQPPEGLHILHQCDNPPCCNPAHLSLGTHQDNMADQVAKRRHVYGERSRRNKLTREQVAIVRAEFRKDGRRSNGAELARRFGVGRNTIEAVVYGRTWKIDTPAPVLHPDRVRPVRKQS